jgi:hypothetical protein
MVHGFSLIYSAFMPLNVCLLRLIELQEWSVAVVVHMSRMTTTIITGCTTLKK